MDNSSHILVETYSSFLFTPLIKYLLSGQVVFDYQGDRCEVSFPSVGNLLSTSLSFPQKTTEECFKHVEFMERAVGIRLLCDLCPKWSVKVQLTVGRKEQSTGFGVTVSGLITVSALFFLLTMAFHQFSFSQDNISSAF